MSRPAGSKGGPRVIYIPRDKSLKKVLKKVMKLKKVLKKLSHFKMH